DQFKTENEAWEAKRAELERDCQSLQTKRAAHSEWEAALDHKQETLHRLIDQLANSQSSHSKEYERIDVVIAALGEERTLVDAERAALNAEVAAFKETQSNFEAACAEFERLYVEFENDRGHLDEREAELCEWHAAVEKVRATLAEEQASLKNDRLAL